MYMVPRRDNIFWFLLIYIVCSKNIPCSLASQDLYTQDIRPSINSDVLTSSDIIKSTRPSINSDVLTSSDIIKSTRPSINSDVLTSSAISKSTRPSINSDVLTSSAISKSTRPSINADVLTSSAITKSTRPSTTPDGIRSSVVTDCTLSSQRPDQMHSSTFEPIWPSINSDKTSSLADTTKYHVTSSTGPATTLPAPAIVTGSTYLLLGEDLVLTCSLSNQYLGEFTAINISFRHSYPSVPQSPCECVPQSSVQVIDEKTAKLNISNVTFHNIGQYTCFAGDTSCQFGVQPTNLSLLGFANDVNIEYPPHNVTNFTCVVYNWDEYMDCTWQHPVQYKDWSNIEVTSLYSMTRLDPSKKCPNLTNTGCFWVDFISDATYKVQVVVTNKLKQGTASTTFTNKAIKNVKPAPIEDLTIVPWAGKAGCLLISWTHPRVDRSKVYIIQHKEVDDGQFTNLTDNFRNESYISCGYRPYTRHNFSVLCLPTCAYSGYVSDPVYKDVWTPMTEPDLGPAATNGSFASTPCIDGLRNVTLMWKAVDPAAQNGIITDYLITLGPENLTSAEAGVFSATVMLRCDSVSVAIFAINKAGLSVSPTILLISTVTVSAEVQSSFVVEIKSTGKVHSSWEDKREVKGEVDYTIFWCRGRLEQSCEDELQWQEVLAGDTGFDVPVDNSAAGDYIYGISARNVQTGIASQLFWTPCLFTRHPPKRPSINTLHVKGLVGSVYITWSADSCKYQDQIRLTSFVVKWRQTTPGDEPSPISNATVPAGESTYTVSSLPPDVNYSVTVQPMSYDTAGSEVDPWKVASATHQENSTLPLAAVLGGLASAAVLLILLLLACGISFIAHGYLAKSFSLLPSMTQGNLSTVHKLGGAGEDSKTMKSPFIYCQRRRNNIKKLRGDNPIVDLPTEIAAELGPPLQELAPEAPARDQPQCPVVTDVNSPMSLSAESESDIRGISENGYSKLIREESEVCNNGQEQGSRQSEQDSLADAGCMPHPGLQSSDVSPHVRPPSNGYSRFFGSQSTSEVCKKGQEQGSRQSEPDSTTDPGYMPHPGLQSSDVSPHARPPSNGYSRVVGNEREVCNRAEDHTSRQSEQGSTTDPGYMPHPVLQSSENAHTRPPSNSYSRVVGNERQVCNSAEDHTSRQSEQESTCRDPGYMSLPSLQSSQKALHKANGYISGSLPPTTVFTIVPSNSDSSELYKNAPFENYSEEEETHSRQFSILSSLALRDVDVTGEVALEDILVLGDSHRPAIKQPATERSTLPDDRTHETANERLCVGDHHRIAETDPQRPAVVLTRIVRAASYSTSASHTLTGRTPAPADINEGQEVSPGESDTDGSYLLQNLHDYSSPSIPMRINGLGSGTCRDTSDYIQLARLQSSEADTSV